jgi:dolichol-phosphate mannosyltransferase
MIYGFFAVWQHTINHATVSGWTSVIVSILIMGGIQVLILGIIGEYLGRAFIQAKHRPDYIIKERSPS